MTGPGGHHPSAISGLADLRVVVDRVEGRQVCGLKPGDWFSVSKSSQLSMPEGGHFCLYALAAVLPLLPAQALVFRLGAKLLGVILDTARLDKG